VDKLNRLLSSGVSRRTFLAGAGATAGTAAVTTLAAGCGSSGTTSTAPTATPSAGTVTDENILNFALNLEYLEAQYYLIATTGAGIPAANTGTSPGTVTGGAQVTFASPAIASYAAEIANDELNHVLFLRSALGSAAVSMPAIDFTDAFNAAAVAAGIVPAGGTFNPFADEASFLVGAFVFEDVGVTAYHGAATLLTSKTYLGAAAGIMAVEGYHASTIRTALTYLGDPYLTYANQISALRAAAGGGAEVPVSGSTIVPADANSIAFDRTTSEVLHIVYLNPTAGVVSGGGFFPNGMNGAITASTT
jgi:hypothetical protein